MGSAWLAAAWEALELLSLPAGLRDAWTGGRSSACWETGGGDIARRTRRRERQTAIKRETSYLCVLLPPNEIEWHQKFSPR